MHKPSQSVRSRALWATLALLTTTTAMTLGGSRLAAADGGADTVLWQVGTFDGGPAAQRAQEYPQDHGFTDTFTYAAAGIDATPDFPGHLRDIDGGQQTRTARVLRITFSTPCPYAEAVLRYDRAGSEGNTLDLDGAELGSVAVAEGASASFTFDLGTLPAGGHLLTITYVGEGADNGHFIDALRMTTNARCGVGIDIKPGSDANPVNPSSRGKVPVAILSTAHLDAPADVDASILTFGRTGDEVTLSHCSGAQDVDGDGRLDLVCHFRTQDTGFQQGDTAGVLRGSLHGGTAFEGHDVVTVV